MPTVQHGDFGEKIGGAKKDLWKERGLTADDLDGMNEREAAKYVKKDNIWKKPDYDAMITDGTPVDTAYFIKMVRDSLNASPRYFRTDDTPEKRAGRQRQYVETIRRFKDAAEAVTTREDAMQMFDEVLLGGGFIERDTGYGGGWRLSANGRDNPLITNKLFRALHFASESDYKRKITDKAAREQFGVAKEQKIPKGFEIRRQTGKDGAPDTFFIAKGHRIIDDGIESYDAALAKAKETAASSRGGKKRFIPEQLTDIKRYGPDRRGGKDATGDDFIRTFGFRGGEFGNWMTQNDRRASLNMGFDALKDLAESLETADRDISFGGTLAIAFGARGSGNAAAHYEPLRKVINLTKMHGAGSLAHEWWHALDDHLGGKMGAAGFLTDNPRLYAPIAKLVDAMKYKIETPEQAQARVAARAAQTLKMAEVCIDSAVRSPIRLVTGGSVPDEYQGLKEAFLSGDADVIGRLSDLRKSHTGSAIPKDAVNILAHHVKYINEMNSKSEIRLSKTETDFYKGSKKMTSSFQRDGGYWDSNTEMSARAFACYIMDRLPYRSDYLAGHAESAMDITADKGGTPEIVFAYPKGEERATINAAFDEIVADLKKERRLTHEDKAPSVLGRLKEAQERGCGSKATDSPTKMKTANQEL